MKDQINKDFITAMKARDRQKANALKMLRAAIKQVEIDERKELGDTEVEKILRSELKKRKEAVEQYKSAGRDDLVSGESFEAELIESYLPELMSREDVEKEVENVLLDVAEGANFGQVMGKCMAVLKGKADGKLVQEVVKEKMKG